MRSLVTILFIVITAIKAAPRHLGGTSFITSNLAKPSAGSPARRRTATEFSKVQRVLHLTDIHYDKSYSTSRITDANCRITSASSICPGKFGDYECDSPEELIDNVLDAAVQIIPNPDLVIWTGDTAPHVESYTVSDLNECIQSVTDKIDNHYKLTNVMPTLGNHDFSPSNFFPDVPHSIYENTFSLWKKWIGEENAKSFAAGGYYKFALPNNVTLLGLNTNLYLHSNRYKENFKQPEDPAGQFQFMTDTLSEAERNNGRVFIIGHMAPGASEHMPYNTWMAPQYNKRFVSITLRFAKVIKLMSFGHYHADTFHIVKDLTTHEPKQLYIIAPSVTPRYNHADRQGSSNPALRILDFDRDTQELLDITTYYIDLDKLNKNASAQWSIEYSMREAYGIGAVNAVTMNEVLEKMKADDSVFQKYVKYNSVSYNYTRPDNPTRARQLCAIEFVDYESYADCLERSIPNTTASSLTSSSPATTITPLHQPLQSSVDDLELLSGNFHVFRAASSSMSSSSTSTTTTVTPIPQNGCILQFTDFHYDKQYSIYGSQDAMCHAGGNTKSDQSLGEFGDYACDANERLIKNMLAAAKKIIPDPDYILWTGDNFPHIDDYSEFDLTSTIEAATKFIKDQFTKTLVIPLFGNHDYAPANAFPDTENNIYRAVFTYWKDWIGEENRESFLKGGYYKLRLPNNVLILALNTNLYYKFNSAISNFTNKTDPAEQFQFMIDNLGDAERNNETVHIVSHMAPGVFDRTPYFTWMVPEYNQRFIDITVRYANVINWEIFGHHHTDTFHIVKDPVTAKPVQVYLMAPAVTPWFSSLEGAGSNNPAFRVFDYDPFTQTLLDARTYYVDLNELNKNESAEWQLEYSMKEAYGIDKIDAENMNLVLEAMKSDNQTLLKYIEYNSVRWEYSMPIGKFRAAQLCSIEFPSLGGYYDCMQRLMPTTTMTITVSTPHNASSTTILSSSEALTTTGSQLPSLRPSTFISNTASFSSTTAAISGISQPTTAIGLATSSGSSTVTEFTLASSTTPLSAGVSNLQLRAFYTVMALCLSILVLRRK